jgi:hypothetical protein
MLINQERIREMLNWVPRRYRLSDFERPLKARGEFRQDSQDWNLMFPFWETFVPAFEKVCKVNHIGFRKSSTGALYYTFLTNVTDVKIEEVRNWLSILSLYVALRNC